MAICKKYKRVYPGISVGFTLNFQYDHKIHKIKKYQSDKNLMRKINHLFSYYNFFTATDSPDVECTNKKLIIAAIKGKSSG